MPEPPIAVVSHDTAKLADVGFWPGVIVPLSVTVWLGLTGDGVAEPVAVGLIEIVLVVTPIARSSTASASSLPAVSTSVQRIQTV